MTTIKIQNEWTLYDHSKSNKEGYGTSIRIIGHINNTTNFANIFKLYPEPSLLFSQIKDRKILKPVINLDIEERKVSSISLFKNGIRPEWEHELNINGGELQFKMFQDNLINSDLILENLDTMWYKLTLCILSNHFTDHDKINGIRLIDNTSDDKLSYRIEIWHSKISEESLHNLSKEICNCINFKDKVIYKIHSKT